MQRFFGLLALLFVLPSLASIVDEDTVDADTDADEGHHHHHGHHKHHKKKKVQVKQPVASKDNHVVTAEPRTGAAAVHASAVLHAGSIVDKMKAIEAKIAKKQHAVEVARIANRTQGHLLINGPLPADFNERFAQAVGFATSTDPNAVKITDSTYVEDSNGVVEVAFVASPAVVKDVEEEAADPQSKLANGNMHSFLVAEDDKEQGPSEGKKAKGESKPAGKKEPAGPRLMPAESPMEATPVEEKGIDIDTAMPYGDLEPFGREDTAQELTESSVKESDEMVDQLERAEVAEEKRAVFRSLTRLRGAAITSFDGVARSQTGNIDEYNKIHKWRKTHPLHHLADEESDVSKWAFPDNADFIQTKVHGK